MTRNQRLAVELDHPSCQDTGVLQFWVKCGTGFPLIDEVNTRRNVSKAGCAGAHGPLFVAFMHTGHA